VARINFEDSIYKHPNYSKLLIKVGDPYRVKGILVTAWELAQLYWLQHKAVPFDKWPEDLNVLFDFSFASIELRGNEKFVYVSGSKEACGFLEARSSSGRMGGLAKASKRQQVLANDSKLKQNVASYSVSVSGSFSNSDSSSSSKNTILPDLPKGQSRRVFDFESLYKKFPRKEGKQRGLKVCAVQVKTQEDFDQLSLAIDRYAEHIKKQATEARYIKHFSTFMGEWRDWLEKETGTVALKPKEEPEWIRKAREEEAKNAV